MRARERERERESLAKNKLTPKIDIEKIRKRVVFWTVFAIALAYAILFLFAFAPSAGAITIKTEMKCNVAEGKMMNWTTNFAEDGAIISEK
jgi:hypothetical protein